MKVQLQTHQCESTACFLYNIPPTQQFSSVITSVSRVLTPLTSCVIDKLTVKMMTLR